MNTYKAGRLATIAAFALIVALSAQADPVIYLQPPDLHDNAINGSRRSDFDMIGPRGANQILDDFVLEWADEGAYYELTDIHWLGTYWGRQDVDDDFTIRLFEEGETPSLIAEFTPDEVDRSDSGLVRLNVLENELPVWLYEYDLLAPIYLDPGATYYLSVVNNTPDECADWAWVYGLDGNGWIAERITDEDPWHLRRHDMAFALTGGIVPEPATLTLLGLGLAGLLIKNKRRSK